MNAALDRWDQWRDHAVAVSILDVAARLGARLKPAGSDHLGACPLGCAKRDGFIVTPAKGIFLCRPSGATGDVIDLVQHVNGCSYAEAVEFITGETRPDRSRDENDDERFAREARWRSQQEAARRRADEAVRQEAARQRRSSDHIADVLERAVPIAGTHAEAYLMRGRKLEGVQRRFLSDLRFVADLPYWGYADELAKELTRLSDGLPAMVAPFRDTAGSIVGLHQTFLDPVEPRKWVPPGDQKRNKAKKMRGAPCGALIRLGRVSEVLAAAEGIETGLSWALLMTRRGQIPAGVSLAAAGSIGNLCGQMVMPEGVRELILLVDSDRDYRASWMKAKTAVARFEAQGVVVRVHAPPVGMDWANVWEAMA